MTDAGWTAAPGSPASGSPTLAEPGVAILLPGPLLTLFPGAPRCVTVPAATVAEAIDALDRRWPGMGDRIRDSSPAIRRHMNVFVDGERAGLHTALPAGAELIVMTAISGG